MLMSESILREEKHFPTDTPTTFDSKSNDRTMQGQLTHITLHSPGNSLPEGQ